MPSCDRQRAGGFSRAGDTHSSARDFEHETASSITAALVVTAFRLQLVAHRHAAGAHCPCGGREGSCFGAAALPVARRRCCPQPLQVKTCPSRRKAAWQGLSRTLRRRRPAFWRTPGSSSSSRSSSHVCGQRNTCLGHGFSRSPEAVATAVGSCAGCQDLGKTVSARCCTNASLAIVAAQSCGRRSSMRPTLVLQTHMCTATPTSRSYPTSR